MLSARMTMSVTDRYSDRVAAHRATDMWAVKGKAVCEFAKEISILSPPHAHVPTAQLQHYYCIPFSMLHKFVLYTSLLALSVRKTSYGIVIFFVLFVRSSCL